MSESTQPSITPNPVKALLDDIQKSLGTASFVEKWKSEPELLIFILKRIYFDVGAILSQMGHPIGETDLEKRLASAEKDAMMHKMIWEKTYAQYGALWDCWRNSKTNDEIAETLYKIIHGWSCEI